MKRTILILIIFSLYLTFCSKNQISPTHTLELLTPDAGEPASANISFIAQEDKQYIIINFPGESLKSEFINVNDSIAKFQLAQIRNNTLVDIQFVGYGDIDNIIEGEFNAYLDFTHREDMSGKFKLIRSNP